MIFVVLDCIKFKLFVMLFCHNELLLQHVFIVSCFAMFEISHFGLYYLYSSINDSIRFDWGSVYCGHEDDPCTAPDFPKPNFDIMFFMDIPFVTSK